MLRRIAEQRGQGLLEYALIITLVTLVAAGALVAMGPQVGGIFSTAHYKIRGLMAGGPTPTSVAATTPTPLPTPTPIPATPTPTPTPLPTLPPAPPPPTVPVIPTIVPIITPSPAGPCRTIGFRGGILVTDRNRDGFSEYLSLRWAIIRDTRPHGDPLVGVGFRGWFFVRLEPIHLTGKYERHDTQTIFAADPRPLKLTISNFRRQVVLVGTVVVDEVRVSHSLGRVNETLTINLRDIQVNNVIRSPVLEAFAAQKEGAMAFSFGGKHRSWRWRSIASLILTGQTLYAPATGTIRTASCQ